MTTTYAEQLATRDLDLEVDERNDRRARTLTCKLRGHSFDRRDGAAALCRCCKKTRDQVRRA